MLLFDQENYVIKEYFSSQFFFNIYYGTESLRAESSYIGRGTPHNQKVI